MIKKIFFTIMCCLCFYCFAAGGQVKEQTEITGEMMTLKENENAVIFTGGAKVVRGDKTIKADRMEYKKTTGLINAYGNVKFFLNNKDGKVNAFAQNAVYNVDNYTGKLWGGKPLIEYNVKDSTEVIKLYADTFYLENALETARAESNVEIISSSGTIISDNALIDKKSKTLYMHKDIKKPQVTAFREDKTAVFEADEIYMLYEDKTVTMKNNVKGKITIESDNLEDLKIKGLEE
ncbi:LptA/OstA family protein [Candidatus Ruminimicrobium bovinum]|uniref:LptA/OstA family protein n=1 Tax=Candidatus Ruminimicrobium bovinum TaxID=3242779 RepID=UPI0039B83DA5